VASYGIGEAAALLGVSADTVRRWVDGGRLDATRTAGGRRRVDGEGLARLAVELAAEAGAGGEPAAIGARSARNRFPGLVTRVEKDGVAATVEVQAGPHRVVSLMTREAADELGLEPGMLVVASTKATNVVVELPARG
jgi:molybdopterin-binding protein